MKNIELPRRVLVGDGAIEEIKNITHELGFSGKSLVLADKNTRNIAGDYVSSQLGSDVFEISGPMMDEISRGVDHIKENGISFVVGTGGGTVIDITKVCAYKAEVPFVSIPTAASHDGITSSQASIKGEKHASVRVHSAHGILVDTAIIRKAPFRLTAAGCADAVSNYSAVLDWKLAHREKNVYYGDYAANLSMMSARLIMHNAKNIKDNIRILVEALISSGVAMGIAGSSRPCSGAEHQFSHALDQLCPKPALHGEQCGVGTILMVCLHGGDWHTVRDALIDFGAPVNAKGLGIEDKYIIDALTIAHSIRDRYTILRDGLSRDEAISLARETEVIE